MRKEDIPGRRRAIAEAYAAGMSIKECREKFGYSNPRVVAAAFGVPPRNAFRKAHKFSAEKNAAILADYDAGIKLMAIAAAHGCSDAHIRSVARRAGRTDRSKQWRQPSTDGVFPVIPTAKCSVWPSGENQ